MRPSRPRADANARDITIYFVRHGETDWNAEARYQGQADVPMNETGRAQARRNGEALRAFFPASPRPISSRARSPARARPWRSCAMRWASIPIAYRIDDRLKEAHYGDWEGSCTPTCRGSMPKACRRARGTRSAGARGAARATRTSWRARSTGSARSSATRWSSRTAGVSRVLRGHILGLDPASVPSLDVPQDRVLVLRRDGIDWL